MDMNTDLRRKAEADFEKDFFKLMTNSVFEKTMENMRKHRDIKLVTTERRRNYQNYKQKYQKVSEPNYHTTKFFAKNLLVIQMKKLKYLWTGHSLLELCKIFLYQFWYVYVKPKYGKKSNLCYVDMDHFIHKNR